jgi:hypothetical protein
MAGFTFAEPLEDHPVAFVISQFWLDRVLLLILLYMNILIKLES